MNEPEIFFAATRVIVGDINMNKLNNSINKKRKNQVNNVKKYIKTGENTKNLQKVANLNISVFAWVKTLICLHDAFSNAIKLIDKIISTKATSVTQGSSIFGDYKHGTYNQVQELLDIQERKLSLINLYSLTESMVDSLPQKYKEFVSLKFYKHKKMQYISEALEIDERTAFRWSHYCLNELVKYCENNNLTDMFFRCQTSSEPWIKEHFDKHYKRLKDSIKV